MARYFYSPSSQLLHTSAPITSEPFTMACWYWPFDQTGREELMILLDYDGPNHEYHALEFRGDLANDYLRAASYAIDIERAEAAGMVSKAWNHCAGTWANDSLRTAYVNGGNKNVDTGQETVEGLSSLSIGGGYRDTTNFGYVNGALAEPAIWNVALTDEEIAILALGVSPLLVRPQSLVTYFPFIRDNDEDLIGGLSLSAVGTPTVVAHPRVFYIAPPALSHITLVVGEVTWGHDTGVVEVNVLDFAGNWTGTGEIISSGDDEQICLDVGEYMESNIVDTGAFLVTLFQNLYDGTGDDVTLRYRHGATLAACVAAAWNNYTVPFVSAGYVQVRLEAT